MKQAPIPSDDLARVAALQALAILDTPPEERFDRITRAATRTFGAPFSTISLIDRDREWYKSRQGIEQTEGKRSVSFCGHALYAPNVFIVEDTLEDSRFADNPYVVGTPYIRSYIGVTLNDRRTKQPIGVFCIKDTKPRSFSEREIVQFNQLALAAEDELNQSPGADQTGEA